MSRMKTFFKYALLLVGFYIFSNILIFLALNSMYDNLDLIGSLPEQIEINIANATLVNGEISGNITNNSEIYDKYIKFNFYTDINTLAGSKYIKVSDIQDNNFKFYFKLEHVESYSVEIVDEKTDGDLYESSFSFEEYKKYQIVYWLVLLMII